MNSLLPHKSLLGCQSYVVERLIVKVGASTIYAGVALGDTPLRRPVVLRIPAYASVYQTNVYGSTIDGI